MAKPRGLYTPIYASLPRHLKVQEAAKALRCDRHKLIGHLVSFWTWCLTASSQVLTADVVATAAEWPARTGQRFADVLCEVGFLERAEGGYRVHEWGEYGGKVATIQVKDRERHSTEIPQSLHGNSSLDETRRDETRSDPPVAPRSNQNPPTVTVRLWEVYEALAGRLTPPPQEEHQFEAWVQAGATVEMVDEVLAATREWSPDKPWAAFRSAMGTRVAQANNEPQPKLRPVLTAAEVAALRGGAS